MSWFRNRRAHHPARPPRLSLGALIPRARDERAGRLFCACLLAALLAGVSSPAAAQESYDQRVQRAKDQFNVGKMEEACDAFKLLDQEKTGDKSVQAYLKMSCDQVKAMLKMEEDLFNQGVQLFNQGQIDDARQKFEQSGKIQLKRPRFRDKAVDYLRKIDEARGKARTEEETRKNFEEGVRLFNAKSYSEAREAFNKVANAGGPKAGDARNYLAKIQDALGKQRTEEELSKTFDDGVRLYKSGKNADAFSAFEKVAKAGGAKAAEAQNYLQKIEEAQKKELAKKESPKPPREKKEVAIVTPPKPPSKPAERPAEQAAASDETLRAGLKAYYTGDLETAGRDLTDYLTHNGQKQELAFFFRGATYSSRYFLSGEKDSELKDLAVKDFQSTKSRGQGFQPPPQKYVSPKILALYSQAASTTSP